MLDDCQAEGNIRGFYNEFLPTTLRPHRKVLEIVGERMLIAPDPQQLSGLGFSSTQRNTVVVRITDHYARPVRVAF